MDSKNWCHSIFTNIKSGAGKTLQNSPTPFKIVPQPPSITPAPTEQQDVNGLETLSMSKTGPSMSDQPVGTTSSPLDSTNLLCDAAGEEQQNENNNHPCKAF